MAPTLCFDTRKIAFSLLCRTRPSTAPKRKKNRKTNEVAEFLLRRCSNKNKFILCAMGARASAQSAAYSCLLSKGVHNNTIKKKIRRERCKSVTNINPNHRMRAGMRAHTEFEFGTRTGTATTYRYANTFGEKKSRTM